LPLKKLRRKQLAAANHPMPALDTNVIVRHVTADHPDHSPRARRYFQDPYNLPRQKICDDLAELIRMPGVKLRTKSLYLRALKLYGVHRILSFVDSLLAAVAEREDGVVMTFDKGFDRVSTITRIEP